MQYRVDSGGLTELTWYRGRITQLSAPSAPFCKESFVSITFQGTKKFEETTEDFTIKSNSKVSQNFFEFPFRFVKEDGQAGTIHNNHEAASDIPSRIAMLEQRVQQLERFKFQPANNIHQHFSGLINVSLEKYMTNTRRLASASNDDMVPKTWDISMDCSLADFYSFRSHLSSSQRLTSLPDVQDALVPSSITIPIQSFKTFCDLFSISTKDYERLLVVRKRNRKGGIVFLKAIGSLLRDKDNASLPHILCIGGSLSSWCDENHYFCREHGHRIHNGFFSAGMKQIRSESVLSESRSSHLEDTSKPLQFKWTLNPTTSLCQASNPQAVVIGKLVASIPFITFADMTVASSILSCLNGVGAEDYESDDTDC